MDERMQTRAGEYALGIMPEAERVDFERALADDAELRRLVADFTDVIGESARALPGLAPSPGLRERVIAAAGKRPSVVEPARPKSKVVALPTWIPWAVAAGLAVGACFLWFERNSLVSNRSRLLAEADVMRGRNATLEETITEIREDIDQLRQREATLVATNAETEEALQEARRERNSLENVANSLRRELEVAKRAADLAELRVARLESQISEEPGALAVSLWNTVTQEGVLVVENLTLPPPGKTYQLWVIDPSTQAPIDAGIFTTDNSGRGRIVFRPKSEVRTAAQFAVSLEAAGGSTTPQGPIVMIGPANEI